MSRPRRALPEPMRISASGSSWPRSRARNRQPVADIGQIILAVAIFIVLRAQRHAADLAVAGGEAAAGGAHAAPFRAIDRHRVDDAERGARISARTRSPGLWTWQVAQEKLSWPRRV